MGISQENPTSPLFFSANAKTYHFPFLFLPCAQTFLLPASFQFLQDSHRHVHSTLPSNSPAHTRFCFPSSVSSVSRFCSSLFPSYPDFLPLFSHCIFFFFICFLFIFLSLCFVFYPFFVMLSFLLFFFCSFSLPFMFLFFDPVFVPLHFFILFWFLFPSVFLICFGIFYAFYFSLAKLWIFHELSYLFNFTLTMCLYFTVHSIIHVFVQKTIK